MRTRAVGEGKKHIMKGRSQLNLKDKRIDNTEMKYSSKNRLKRGLPFPFPSPPFSTICNSLKKK